MDGWKKFTWLKMLKKSAENSTLKRSWKEVDFPRRASRFQNPKPRRGLPVPSRPSVAISTGRKSAATAPGLAKRLRPVPCGAPVQLGPSPLDPKPLVLQTLPCRPAPSEPMEAVGMALRELPKKPPPRSPSTTVSGGPLAARKTPDMYQPLINLSAILFPKLNLWPCPPGRS